MLIYAKQQAISLIYEKLVYRGKRQCMYFQIPVLFNQNNKSMYLQIPKLVSSIKITMSDTKFNLMKRTIHVSSDTKGNLMNRIKQKPIRHVTSYTPITYIVCLYKTLHKDKSVV